MRTGGQEYVVLGPEETGRAALLGAHKELIDFLVAQGIVSSRREAIFELHGGWHNEYYEQRKGLTGQDTFGALAVRAEMDWQTGRLFSLVLKYPFGEPRVEVKYALFEKRWVWNEVYMESAVYGIMLKLSVNLSRYAIEP